MAHSEVAPAFTCFNRLPREIRLIIWKLALLEPRIVHFSRKQLATDTDRNWWTRVRSDKAIGGGDYDDFDMDDYDLEKIEKKIAAERLFIPDSLYSGNMSRVGASAIPKREPAQHTRHSIFLDHGKDCPKKLYGLRPDSIPGLLLACRESYGVSYTDYTPAFGGGFFFPQTYVNWDRDTLYLDEKSEAGDWDGTSPVWRLITVLRLEVATDELARVQRLAIRPYPPTQHRSNRNRRIHLEYIEWLTNIQKCFPNLKQLFIVPGHYAHRDRTTTARDRSESEYEDLKLIEFELDAPHIWSINGSRIDTTLALGGKRPEIRRFDVELKEARQYWPGDSSHVIPWNLPQLEYNFIASSADEMRLHDYAQLFQPEHQTGFWYSDPRDPTDCDSYAGEAMDLEVESLIQ